MIHRQPPLAESARPAARSAAIIDEDLTWPAAPREKARIIRTLLLAAALGVPSSACGRERETGVPPTAVSDSAIPADTARRDKVDLEGIRTGN